MNIREICRERDYTTVIGTTYSFDPLFFEIENPNILNKILIKSGGSLNFVAIFKASDFATFLHNLNSINNLLIIIFSIQNE